MSLLASFEYLRFVQLAKRGLDYTPRTAMLAVVVSVILAILEIAMAVYLIAISPERRILSVGSPLGCDLDHLGPRPVPLV